MTLTQAGKDFVALLKDQQLASDVFDFCRRIGKISDTEVQTALTMGNKMFMKYNRVRFDAHLLNGKHAVTNIVFKDGCNLILTDFNT